MSDPKIYNYRLILRFRHKFFWTISFIIIFITGIFLSDLNLTVTSFKQILIYLGIFVFIYFILNSSLLTLLKRKIKFAIPFIPWFGIFPKQMLSYKEYLKLEIGITSLFSLSFVGFIIFLPKSLFIIFYTLWFIFIIYRFILFIRIILLRKSKVWIKYDVFGISVYQTD